MIICWIIPLGLYVIITVQHQLTTVGTRRYTLRINPAYQYACGNTRKKWRGGASLIGTGTVEEHDEYRKDLARPLAGYGGMTFHRRSMTLL